MIVNVMAMVMPNSAFPSVVFVSKRRKMAARSATIIIISITRMILEFIGVRICFLFICVSLEREIF